jgi:hypothetical protein
VQSKQYGKRSDERPGKITLQEVSARGDVEVLARSDTAAGEVTLLMIPAVMHEHYNYGHVISMPTSDLGQNCSTAAC